MRFDILCLAGLLAPQAASPEEEVLKKLAADLPAHVKAADADGNGAIGAAEFRILAPALRKAADEHLNKLVPAIAEKKAAKDLKKYDKNADGRLDDDEKKALAEERRLKDIKDFDWDGDGKLAEREQTAMAWAAEGKSDGRFRKLDTGADGALSAGELAAGLPSISGVKVKKPKAP